MTSEIIEVQSPMVQEKQLLMKWYGPNMDEHDEIKSLTKMLTQPNFILVKPSSNVFDGLNYVMEKQKFQYDIVS